MRDGGKGEWKWRRLLETKERKEREDWKEHEPVWRKAREGGEAELGIYRTGKEEEDLQVNGPK